MWWYTGAFFQKNIEAIGARFSPMQTGLDYSIIDNVPAELSAQRSKLRGLAQLKFDLEYFLSKPQFGNTQDLLRLLEEFPADGIVADSFLADHLKINRSHEVGRDNFLFVRYPSFIFQ